MPPRRTFLAEAYAPSSADLELLLEQARLVAERSSATTPIRHVRSFLVREDETCFHLFEAESLDELSMAIDTAELRAHRIVEVAW